MPEQVAVVSAFRHWFDPSWHVADDYVFTFGKSQYVLFHVVGALLSILTGSAEVATKLLLTASGFAMPYALVLLLRALDRDPRLAVFGAAPFWSRPLTMGFVPYVASVPVTAWGLALATRQARAPTKKRAIGLAILAVLLFYLHANAYVLFVLGAVAIQLAMWRGLWPTARALVWLVPSAILAGAWSLYGAMAHSLDQGFVIYTPLRELIAEFPSWSHDTWQSHVDEGCAIALWSAFGCLVIQRGETTERRLSFIAALPFACAALTFILMPYGVGVGVMLNVRIAVFVTLFAPLLIETVPGWRSSLPLAVATAATFVLAGDAVFEVRRIEREEIGDVGRLLDRVAPNAHVLTLPFHLTSRHTHWAPWTFIGSYARARHGGVASFSFSEIDHWPVHYRVGKAPPPKGIFWTFDSCQYRNEIDGLYFDYVLSRGNVDPFRDAPPGPVWEKVDVERDFTLWKKVAGATSPRWSIDDGGPCESRRSLERDAQQGHEKKSK